MSGLKSVFLITDLDGTLLPECKEILPQDAEAIVRFRDAGGMFSIATGRTLQAAKRYLDELQLTMPVILYNGAAIYDPVAGQMLETTALPVSAGVIVQTVLDAFPDVSAEILRTDGAYVPRVTPYEEQHLKICQVKPFVMPLEEIPRDGWLKVLFAISPERMQALISFVETQGWSEVNFVQSASIFYEILPCAVTKGSALRRYRGLCGLEHHNIVAAGDYDNDLEMLRAADYSACPSNAQACVKEIVDLQLSASCETGAIAELIADLSK